MSLENINKAKSLFYEGMEYLQENNYSNAEEKLLSALNLLPERLSIVGNLFTIYFVSLLNGFLSELRNSIPKNKPSPLTSAITLLSLDNFINSFLK